MKTLMDVEELFYSPTNPRGEADFKGQAFDDLVASVKEKGVIVPLVVRRVGEKFEVIAGNRRLRAAKAAGATEVPVRLIVAEDSDVREIQIVENLHRADVSPLEEGEAYRQLIETSKQTPDDVAVKVGKSVQYVRSRLVLTNLIPAGRKMLAAGDLALASASLIARLDEKDQAKTIKWAKEAWDAPDTAKVREWIQQHVYTDMSRIPWEAEDMRLAVEDCEECPKGKSDLFGKDAAGRCPNPKCWARKMAAYIAAKRQADPQLVLLQGGYGQAEKYGADKDAVWSKSDCHWIEGKKDRCDHAVKGIVVAGNDIGTITEVCLNPKCEKHSHQVADYAPSPDEKARRKREKKAAEAAEARANAAIGKALGRVKWPMTEKQLGVLFRVAVMDKGTQTYMPICKRRGIKPVVTKHGDWTERDYETPLVADAKKGGAKGMLGLIFEIVGWSYGAVDTVKELKGL